MIVWAYPWVFLLAPLVLALPWQPRLTGRAALHVPGPNVHEGGWSVRRALAVLPPALRVVAGLLLLAALARPQITHRDTVVTSEGLDIMLAIDTSSSMRAGDLASGRRNLNRLDLAKAVMAEFVKARTMDRVGVVVFGSEAYTHVPLTHDHNTLLQVLSAVQIGVAGDSATAIGTAIAVGAKRLKDLEAPSKILILLTDGNSNAGSLTPLQAADLARKLGIRIYTVGVGAQGPRGGLDQRTLSAVAEATGGRFFMARNADSLREVYRVIDELEPSPGESEELTRNEERYADYLLPAWWLLVLEWLLSTTVLRRWP